MDSHPKNQDLLYRAHLALPSSDSSSSASSSSSSSSSSRGRQQPREPEGPEALRYLVEYVHYSVCHPLKPLSRLAMESSEPMDSALGEFNLRSFFHSNLKGKLTFASSFTPLPSSSSQAIMPKRRVT